MAPFTLTQFSWAAKTYALRLSQVPQGEIQVHDYIPRHYFSLEKCLSTSPNICKLWNGRGRWHKCMPLQSSRKRWKCEPQHNAWGWIYKGDCCRSVHASERTLSRAGCYSRRGCACGSKRSGAWGVEQAQCRHGHVHLQWQRPHQAWHACLISHLWHRDHCTCSACL